jgi:hypothetical protein
MSRLDKFIQAVRNAKPLSRIPLDKVAQARQSRINAKWRNRRTAA